MSRNGLHGRLGSRGRVPYTILGVLFVVGSASSTRASPAVETTNVRIFAAASLTDALDEAVAEFTKAHPDVRVVPQFGGSSDLARQIVAGAPADLFFSADEQQMDRVVQAGIPTEDRTNLLSNQLVVVMPSASAEPLKRLEDLPRGRIAMADPEAVPAGVYARRYLERRGLWAEWRERIVPTLDVRGALAAVASGNVAAGFVYRTDAGIEPRVRIVYRVPLEKGPHVVYPLALTGEAPSEAARALFRYLRSEAAAEVFERYGFLRLTEER